jgi:hypothetical protein
MTDTPNIDGKPVQNPITGAKDLGDLSRPTQVLANSYRAFHTRDVALIDTNCASADEFIIDNPLGGIGRGRDQPHFIYEKIFKVPPICTRTPPRRTRIAGRMARRTCECSHRLLSRCDSSSRVTSSTARFVERSRVKPDVRAMGLDA